MSRPARRTLFLLSSLCLAAALRAQPVSNSTPVPAFPEPEHFSWTGKISAGKTLQVRNAFGDIRARYGGDEGKVEVSAVLQHLTTIAPPLKVTIIESEKSILITVGYPLPVPAAAEHDGPPPRKDRADLVVFVPKGTLLDALTQDGLIEAKGLQSDLVADSGKGNIWARVNGSATAHSERGEIQVFLDPA